MTNGLFTLSMLMPPPLPVMVKLRFVPSATKSVPVTLMVPPSSVRAPSAAPRFSSSETDSVPSAIFVPPV